MNNYRFLQVDVFTDKAFAGNCARGVSGSGGHQRRSDAADRTRDESL